MKYFASWTSRDPHYHDYDNDASILVSPMLVPQYWNVSCWNNIPKELFIDSGAYTKSNKLPSCRDVLSRQIAISKGWDFGRSTYFSHPDIIIPLKASYPQIVQIIKSSIERARDYFALLNKKKIQVIPIGVLHGFDEESLLCSYYELKNFGYKYFALGSIAQRFSTDKSTCLKTIETVLLHGVDPLHLFGITWVLQDQNGSLPIHSFDCSAAAKLGFYGTVLYGTPLRRYVIAPSSKQIMHDESFSFREAIPEPLPCNCPICIEDPSRLLPTKGSQAKHARSLHNYFQLKWNTMKSN